MTYIIARWPYDEPDRPTPIVTYRSLTYSSVKAAEKKCAELANANARAGQYGAYKVIDEAKNIHLYTYTVTPKDYWEKVGDTLDFNTHTKKALEHIAGAAKQSTSLVVLALLERATQNLVRSQTEDGRAKGIQENLTATINRELEGDNDDANS